MRKRDTDAALEDKRVDKTFAQQLGLLKKRDVSEKNLRLARAVGSYPDTCTMVLEEVAATLIGQQVNDWFELQMMYSFLRYRWRELLQRLPSRQYGILHMSYGMFAIVIRWIMTKSGSNQRVATMPLHEV